MSNIKRNEFSIDGMSCASCELRIEKALRKIEGVKTVKVSYAEAKAIVEYDGDCVERRTLVEAIEKQGYRATEKKPENSGKFSIQQLVGIGIIILALYLLVKSTVGFNFIPQVDKSVGYGMLFVVGLLTSLHCIAMCGGINLSQCIAHPAVEENRFSKLMPSFLYNAGRVVSYTVIGGIVGALGSVVSFSGTAKAGVTIFAGVFMVVIGVNMLNLIPWMRRFNLRMPRFFGDKLSQGAGKRGPFFVGLLNGLMPCGPLQTMQLYALGTGSFLAGATSMFLFSLGTVPLMFGFGALSSFLSSKFTHRMLKVSAVLVIVLGLSMVSRGITLSGVGIAAPLIDSTGGNVAKVQGGVQVVTTTMENGQYQPFVVQKGIPVRWTIRVKAEDLNGCNNPVTIPKYNIRKKLVPGDNVIKFVPTEEGTITYTCWMGMISSTIKVVPDISKASQKDVAADNGNSSGNGGSSTGSTGSSYSGGCCAAGASATRFYNGRIPTDDLFVAKDVDQLQVITIKVDNQGYSPAAIVVQRGAKIQIKFEPHQLNSCNNSVVFPEYQGELNLSDGRLETPVITATRDFTFQCWMGMLHGYVKVVDDVNKADINAIKREIEAYRPAGGSGGRGGCCGG